MKRCYKCKQEKSLLEFHKNRTRPDGHRADCKVCSLKSRKEYSQTEQGKTVQKRYRQSKEGKVASKRYRQSEKGKLAYRKTAFNFRNRHPERRRAKEIVYYAIKTGRLPRPDTLQCHYRKHPAKEYHHHKGYAQKHRLDVIPVCRKCHTKIHTRKEIA